MAGNSCQSFRSVRTPRRGAFIGGAGGQDASSVERAAGELKASGRPLASKPQHTEAAGWPVTLNGMTACRGSGRSAPDPRRLPAAPTGWPSSSRSWPRIAASVSCCSLQEAQRRDVLARPTETRRAGSVAASWPNFGAPDHVATMDGVRLGRDDDPAADVIVADVGERHFSTMVPRSRITRTASSMPAAISSESLPSAFIPVSRQRDAHALDRALRRRAVIDLGRARRGLVVGVVAPPARRASARSLPSSRPSARAVSRLKESGKMPQRLTRP